MSISTAGVAESSKKVIAIDGATVRFAGDSGDGMQLAGTQLTNTSALAGNDLATFPDYPAEIRAPIGTTYGWQMMGAGIGMATGVAIGGLLHDLTGSFKPTVSVSLVLSLVGVASILVLPSTSRHQLPNWEDALPQEARTATAG